MHFSLDYSLNPQFSSQFLHIRGWGSEKRRRKRRRYKKKEEGKENEEVEREKNDH